MFDINEVWFQGEKNMPEIKVSWPTLAAASTKAAGDGRSAQTDSFLCKKSLKKEVKTPCRQTSTCG